MPEEDALLVMRARKGDAEAIEELLAQYEKRIYNISLRITCNEHDAFDAAQESLIKIYKSITSFRGESSFSSFVYRLTVNTCIDFLRKRKSDVSIEASMEEGVYFEDKNESLNPESAAVTGEIGSRIQKALQKLDEEHRTLIVLKDIQGFSYEEIARILRLSMGTVKSRLFRGREKLKKELAAYINY
jgi:RNA polymerase sigma-70 factor (ECF subfamily)